MLLTFSDLIRKVPGTSGPVNANSELVSPKQRSNKQYKHDYYSFSTEVLSFACYQHLLISTFWAISLKTHYILWKNSRSLVLAVNSLVKFALFLLHFHPSRNRPGSDSLVFTVIWSLCLLLHIHRFCNDNTRGSSFYAASTSLQRAVMPLSIVSF